MLSCSQYKSLRQNDQVDLLLGDGVYLGLTRYTIECYVELYALEGFYVEVHFELVTEEPLFLRPFSDLRHLDPYLDSICIEELSGLG